MTFVGRISSSLWSSSCLRMFFQTVFRFRGFYFCKGNLNGLLLLDLSKAFGLIDHNLLIRKLKIYGLSQSSLNWFNSYLFERKQVVSANRALSNPFKIQTVVPQGSILGRLLYIIYLNDLPLALENPKKLKMSADDSGYKASRLVQDIKPITVFGFYPHRKCNDMYLKFTVSI